LHLKLLGGWTDRSFNLLLDLLNDALPEGSALPRKQYCEVIVSLVLKRDAILPRPHAEMNNMGDALMMAIAWPYKKVT